MTIDECPHGMDDHDRRLIHAAVALLTQAVC